MPDYKKMYFQLFNSVSDAVKLLQEAQRKAEESYIVELPPAIDEASRDPADGPIP